MAKKKQDRVLYSVTIRRSYTESIFDFKYSAHISVRRVTGEEKYDFEANVTALDKWFHSFREETIRRKALKYIIKTQADIENGKSYGVIFENEWLPANKVVNALRDSKL